MDVIWTIAKKELRSFFDSLIAYILLGAFLIFTGFLTWIYGLGGGSDIFMRGQADLRVFTEVAYWVLVVFIPALTMRLLAEERKTGTIELLLTKAVTNRQLVLGKFLACVLMIGIALLFTLPYYITITTLGDVDHGVIICSYLALLLMSAAYIGIGLFASSITDNQIVAFLITFFLGLIFLVVLRFTTATLSGSMGSILNYLNFHTHYEGIARGVLDTKNLIFFFSIIFLTLQLTQLSLAKRQ